MLHLLLHLHLLQHLHQCENIFNSENGLKIHKGKQHKKVEVLRTQESVNSPLEVSPLKEVQRDAPP